MHNVFISYHHENDQTYKNKLIECGKNFGVFIDKSVDTGEIPEHMSDQAIREKIRDEYLRESTVSILLAGTETKERKHIAIGSFTRVCSTAQGIRSLEYL